MSKARDLADLISGANGAGGFVKLDGSSNLPAVGGASLTGISASGGGLADFTNQTPVVGQVITEGANYKNTIGGGMLYAYSGTGLHSLFVNDLSATVSSGTAPTLTSNGNGVFWLNKYAVSSIPPTDADVYDDYQSTGTYAGLATDGTISIRVRRDDGTVICEGTLVAKPTQTVVYNASGQDYAVRYLGLELNPVSTGSTQAVENNSSSANGLNFLDIVQAGGTVPVLQAGERYLVTDLANGEVKLPASPSVGDEVTIVDANQNFGTNALTLKRNGSNILATADDLSIDADGSAFTLIYTGSTKGWVYANK